MNNVEILSEEKILTLKNNQKEVLKLIKQNKDNEWLKEFFKENNPFIKSRVAINDFDLDMSNAEDPSATDFKNSKILHQNLKITESQACDERLWMGLSFSKFYDYMKYRYNPNATNLKNKWFFQDAASKMQIFRQGLSMLWWYAYISYDENNINPYELTEFIFKHKDFMISIYSRNFSGSKHVTLGLIKALKDFERDGGNISLKSIYNGVIKYLSFLGGAYIIDMLSEKEIYDKCYIKLIELYIQEFPDQKIFKL